jgi:Conserved region in glutamate synthase
VEFLGICKAMLETGVYPDFIVVDGAEGGTGAGPLEFMDHVGMPLRDGLMFVHNALAGLNIRQHIRLGASGKIITAFGMVRVMALGADWCNSARGFMFALGCIQSLRCHTDRCSTGVATQDLIRQRALDVSDKASRVASFHRATVLALAEVLAAAGLDHPADLRPHHISKRTALGRVETFDEIYYFLKPGELLSGTEDPRLHLAEGAARFVFAGLTGSQPTVEPTAEMRGAAKPGTAGVEHLLVARQKEAAWPLPAASPKSMRRSASS